MLSVSKFAESACKVRLARNTSAITTASGDGSVQADGWSVCANGRHRTGEQEEENLTEIVQVTSATNSNAETSVPVPPVARGTSFVRQG